MSHLYTTALNTLGIAAACVLFTAAPVSCQTAPAAKPGTDQTWKAPRTPDGHPDLQGIWNSASLTPLERPVDLGEKAFYTPEEAAAYERRRGQELNRDRRDGSTETDLARAYNEAWFDRGTKLLSTRRTSLVIDPPNGRIPPMTPEGKQRFTSSRARFAQHPADGPEDRPLFDRCLLFAQVGPPMLPGNYDDNYEIVQTSGQIAILAEMGYEVRMIALDGRPHLAPNVRQWMGDSIGHWEGDTLVVDTTNVKFNDQTRFGVPYDGIVDQNLHITERFTRTAPDTLLYRATVDDPTVYTKPWTIEVAWSKAPGPLFEYACHEGNYGMIGILSGARVQEKKAAEKSQ